MFKKIFVFLIVFFHLFIVNTSGLETHLCIHESGHISFETVSSNGNCLDIQEIVNQNYDDKEHIKKKLYDPCHDILISKYNKIQEDTLKLNEDFLNDYGKKIVYNIELKEKSEYTSSNDFENIQKIPLKNKSDNIRTFVLLN